MTPERWQLVRAIFDQAVESGPESRARLIHERCGNDPELQREVEALLASEQETGSLLALGQAAALATPVRQPEEADFFGPYVPVRVVGEGGMGTVYLARQQQPIRREVALKVVKLGMDSRQVLDRFEIERQALALMDHPSVARVLDAGTSLYGRPYFVMEYVDGSPITQYCDRHALNMRERLQLFIPVCNALQHAHKKGIIHRDVKPSNVLVMDVDGRPVPKVIDFGIARATDQRSVEGETFTLAGQIIGTPEYMSPEQASLDNADIDTGTDVYSLGIVLYELLVGALPLDIKALRKIAFEEVLRAIRETPVPRPTARITQMGADAEGVARHRSTDPGQLRRDLSGDLDSIVMKAIDKDRRCRYGSASDLALDIERYLKGEPVLAGPPGALYRLRKFMVRHKLPVTAAIAIAIALIAGIIATTWEAQQARQQRERAEQQAAAAQAASQRAIAAEQAATVERDRAIAAEGRAQKERDAALAAKRRGDSEAATAKALRTELTAREIFYRNALAAAPPKVPPVPDKSPSKALPPISYTPQTSYSPQTSYYALGLKYAILQRKGAAFEEVDAGTEFHAGDRIRVRVQTNATAYLYVVARGSNGQWRALFPSKEVASGNNLVEVGKVYNIPPGSMFVFDEKVGVETLLLVLTRSPEPDLEKLIYGVGNSAVIDIQQRAKPILPLDSPLDGSVIDRVRSQLLMRPVMSEKFSGTAPDGAQEKAVYVVTKDQSPEARLFVDLKLVHK